MSADHGALRSGPAVRDTDEAVDQAVAELQTAGAVRTRAHRLLERARAGESRWFVVHDHALDATAADVAEITRIRFPDLDVPVHSRWNHFQAGGYDRRGDLDALLADSDLAERSRAMIDLTLISVLLDAGAGPDWSFVEERDGTRSRYGRSEGLAVASWHGFVRGRYSADPARPLRVDATTLAALTDDDLSAVFQVGPANPLVGLAGRVELLHRLGAALRGHPETFGEQARPGGLFDALPRTDRGVDAHDLLSALLTALSPIWPSDNVIGDRPVGDCWRHEAVAGPGLSMGWMPLHKLSQWLTYSLVEPFAAGGVTVTGLDRLTGLAEYRNGGLLIDSGVLALRNRDDALRTWRPTDELVVEWRALTVALLDELAPLVCASLGLDPARTPLGCVLEGGTWAAGRASAQRLRAGRPPLSIASDGTVF